MILVDEPPCPGCGQPTSVCLDERTALEHGIQLEPELAAQIAAERRRGRCVACGILQDVASEVVEESRSDTVGLWSVVWEVKQRLPSLSPNEVMTAVLQVIEAALEDAGLVAGEFVPTDEETVEFVPWGLSQEETLARVEREWRRLGREPALGDVVWFVDVSLLPVSAIRHPMGEGWKPGGVREQ